MFQPPRKWVNQVNLTSFQLKTFFKFVLAWLAHKRKGKTSWRHNPCLHTLMKTRLSANNSARTILLILYINSHARETEKSQKRAFLFAKLLLSSTPTLVFSIIKRISLTCYLLPFWPINHCFLGQISVNSWARPTGTLTHCPEVWFQYHF